MELSQTVAALRVVGRAVATIPSTSVSLGDGIETVIQLCEIAQEARHNKNTVKHFAEQVGLSYLAILDVLRRASEPEKAQLQANLIEFLKLIVEARDKAAEINQQPLVRGFVNATANKDDLADLQTRTINAATIFIVASNIRLENIVSDLLVSAAKDDARPTPNDRSNVARKELSSTANGDGRMVITSESIRIEHEVDDHSEVRRLTEELTRTRAECEQYKAEAERVTAVLQNTIARFMADAASFHRDKSELQAAFDTLRAEQSHNLARAAAPVSTQVATPDHNTPPSWWKRWLRLLFSSKRGRGRH